MPDREQLQITVLTKQKNILEIAAVIFFVLTTILSIWLYYLLKAPPVSISNAVLNKAIALSK